VGGDGIGYCAKNRIQSHEHIIVPETKDDVPLISQEFVSNHIGFRTLHVLSPIYLYDKPRVETDEVDYISPYRLLTPEFASVELSSP